MSSARSLLTRPFVLVTLAGFCYFLSTGMLLPALPRYVEGPLGGGSLAVGIAVGAFAVSAVVARPFLGRIGDVRGRLTLVVGGGLFLAVGSAGIALVEDQRWLLAMRLVQGVGEAAQFVGAITYVTDLAPAEQRGEAMSYFSVAIYTGLGVGPLLGEWLLDGWGFDSVWVVAGLVALLGAGVGALAPETAPATPAARAATGWRGFVHPAGLRTGVVLGLAIMGLTGWMAFMPLHADELGLDGAGRAFLLYGALVVVVRIAGARLPDRLGYAPTTMAALAAIAVGLLTMGVWPTAAGLYLGTALFAVGMSLLYPALQALTLVGVPDDQRGSVVGTFTAFFDLSQGLGGVILGAVAALTDHEGAFIGAGLLAGSGMVVLRWLVTTGQVAVTGAAARAMAEG